MRRLQYVALLSLLLSFNAIATDVDDCEKGFGKKAIDACIATLDPKDWEFIYVRATQADAAGRTNDALLFIEEAVRRKPDHAHLFAYRGDIFVKLGKRDQAISDYRKAIAIAPGNIFAIEGLKKLGARP